MRLPPKRFSIEIVYYIFFKMKSPFLKSFPALYPIPMGKLKNTAAEDSLPNLCQTLARHFQFLRK